MKRILYDMGCPPFVWINNFIYKELLVDNRQGGGSIIGEKHVCFKWLFRQFKEFWAIFFVGKRPPWADPSQSEMENSNFFFFKQKTSNK